MADLVQVIQDASIDVGEVPHALKKGSVYDKSNPIVRAHKDLFEPLKYDVQTGPSAPKPARRASKRAGRKGRVSTRRAKGSEAPVEAATANPGEKRETQREDEPAENPGMTTAQLREAQTPEDE